MHIVVIFLKYLLCLKIIAYKFELNLSIISRSQIIEALL